MDVSCLMGTRDRRQFVPRAIRCFLFQYAHHGRRLELVIVDDGEDPIEDLIPRGPERALIRYERVGRRMTLDEKRQACVDTASGDILVLWDDDDWHGPERIERQVEALEQTGKGACLLDPILFFDVAKNETWRWSARGRYQMCVGTLAFTRAYLRRGSGKFPPMRDAPSDQQFVRDRPWSEVTYAHGEDCYVAVRHGGNSTGCVMTPGGPWTRAEASARESID